MSHITTLTNLTFLTALPNIKDLSLDSVPLPVSYYIGNATLFTRLSAYSASMDELPEIRASNTKLAFLDIHSNKLTSLDDIILSPGNTWQSLETLLADDNLLGDVSSDLLSQLVAIKRLSLKNNHIKGNIDFSHLSLNNICL